MTTLWAALEERTRGWTALARQAVADAIWRDHTLGRFDGTGDPRALPYLYPYLRSHDRQMRLRALAVSGRVFAGVGRAALPHLEWFTGNPDLFIRDRAVDVVAAAMRGAPVRELLEVLGPFCAGANRFVRRRALDGLAQAGAGTCSDELVAALERTAASLGEALPPSLLGLVHAGHPSEALWARIAPAADVDQAMIGTAWLVCHADQAWFDRALAEVFVPRFSNRPLGGEHPGFVIFRQRNAVHACARAGRGRGMRALAPALPIAIQRCPGHALLTAVHKLFEDADVATERPLVEALIARAPAQEERLGVVALGRLLMCSDDEAAITLLRERCGARHGGVRAAAVQALGAVARSSARADLIAVARPLLADGETVVAALRAIGLITLGTGDAAADGLVRAQMAHWSAVPRARRHHRALAACHWALGLVHLGTGNAAVLDALLGSFALADVPANHEYRAAAAKAVALIEHGEPGLALAAADPHSTAPDHWGGSVYGPWTGVLTSLDP